MIQHCPVFGADAVALDLEDAVSIREKDAARRLVAAFLDSLDFGGVYVSVRVNGAQTPYFEKDLEAIVPRKPAALRIPKCESTDDVERADEIISALEDEAGIPQGSVKIHAMIETARGLEKASDIATSSKRLEALTLGGQDLLADLGIQKTPHGRELLYARSRVVVWTDINDSNGLFEEARLAAELGFAGKAAVHPSQIPVIHEAYKPNPAEVARARRIMTSAKKAESEGKGVFSVDGRMVDAPVIERARHLLRLSELYTNSDRGSETS
jgi:citrate lyase subunit beta/citryl-CoA lyase